MKATLVPVALLIFSSIASAQNVMTAENLWQLGRVSALGLTTDGQQVIYRVSTPVIAENSSRVRTYSVPLTGGSPSEISNAESLLKDKNISPDGSRRITVSEVKIQDVLGKELYPDLS